MQTETTDPVLKLRDSRIKRDAITVILLQFKSKEPAKIITYHVPTSLLRKNDKRIAINLRNLFSQFDVFSTKSKKKSNCLDCFIA